MLRGKLEEKYKYMLSNLIHDEYRYRLQMVIMPLMLGLISMFMCVVNYFAGITIMMYTTLIFSVASFINTAVACFHKDSLKVSYLMFAFNLIILLTAFLVTGQGCGFYTVWILALPFGGMLLLGQRIGASIICVMFTIIIFLLWTPVGYSLLLYDYTFEFRIKFPFVFLCFMVFGYFFEKVRFLTHTELVALQKKYSELSMLDPLTGIHNRRWFSQRVNEIITGGTSILKERTISLFIIDADDFKKINDTLGHMFGDTVLRSIAEIIDRTVGDSGIACRWGGEEFMAMLHNTTLTEVNELTERIRLTVEETLFTDDCGKTIDITISTGVVFAMFRSETENINIEELIKIADRRLYDAKNTGKNRVLTAEILL